MLPDVSQKVDEGQVAQPVVVVAHAGRVRLHVEIQEVRELALNRFRVRGCQLLGEQLALGGLSGRIADQSGAPADQGDRRMARTLRVHQPHDWDEIAEVQARRRRVEADVYGPRSLREVVGNALGGVLQKVAGAKLVE